MSKTTALSTLSDIASNTHVKIQQAHQHINPVIGVSQNMRASGIPADVMTIDCLSTGKRIIMILHDEQPEQVLYQFSFRDRDPAGEFEKIALKELTEQLLFDWVVAYFSDTTN